MDGLRRIIDHLQLRLAGDARHDMEALDHRSCVGCGLAITVAGAQSAPLGSAARDFRSAAAAGPGFENVGYRRAYRYRARRAYGYRAYG